VQRLELTIKRRKGERRVALDCIPDRAASIRRRVMELYRRDHSHGSCDDVLHLVSSRRPRSMCASVAKGIAASASRRCTNAGKAG